MLSAYFFYESDPRRDHRELFFIRCRSMRLLFIWQIFKYYFVEIFLYGNFEHVDLTYIYRLYFLRMPGPHFVTQPILLSENILIFDINHQQNTRRSDQIETIKTIVKLRALVSHGRFYQWLRLPFFKEIFDQVRKDLD